jgi:peptidoglycan/LPS O-acetylase OafA/YrhL
LAALLVFAGHLRALVFVEFEKTQTDNFGKAFYFITGLGHQCVIIFFVLSGFFITKSIHGSIQNSKWSFGGYAIDRLSRLWTVLIPALLITFAFDAAGVQFVSDSPAYRGELPGLPDINPTDKSTPLILFGNALFLQEILVPTFGSNGPLWSLSYEFWYYAIFPLLLFGVVNYYSLTIRILLLVLAIIIFSFVGPAIALYFLIWLFGTASYYLSTRKVLSAKLFGYCGIGIFLFVLTATRFGWSERWFNDFTLGIATGILVLANCHWHVQNRALRQISEFTSNISYTVYLVHLPMAIFFVSLTLNTRLEWGYWALTKYFAFALFVLVPVYGVWYCFERNTRTVRLWIRSRFISSQSVT